MKNICKKTITFSIILLLIGVSVLSAISVDIHSTISNNRVEDCRECKEVSISDLVKGVRLLKRAEIYSKLLLVLSSHNPKLSMIYDGFSYIIARLIDTFQNFNINQNQQPAIICIILQEILYIPLNNLLDMICIIGESLDELFPNLEYLWILIFNPIIITLINIVNEITDLLYFFHCWDYYQI